VNHSLRQTKPVVLIVDDEECVIEIVVSILFDEGFQAFGVSSGNRALEILTKIPAPSLILIDCLMSEMSGAEFIKEFKGKFPEISRDAQLIGISSLPQGSEAGADFECLVQHYEQKPCGLDEWLELVQKHTRNIR
jgi:CheY-like chemotaxis protein